MIKLSTTTIANNYTISDIHLHSHHNPDPLLFFQFFRRYTTNLDTRYHTSSLIYHHHFLTFSPFMAICTTVSGSSIAIFDFFWGRAVPPISRIPNSNDLSCAMKDIIDLVKWQRIARNISYMEVSAVLAFLLILFRLPTDPGLYCLSK